MLKTRLVLIFSTIALNKVFAMGGANEPFETKNAELRSDQPERIFATVFFKENNAELKVEGLNVDCKNIIKNIFLKRKNTTIPSNIKLPLVESIDFDGNEGTSIKIKVCFKSKTTEEYLIDADFKFGSWLAGTEQASQQDLKASELKKIIITEVVPNKKGAKKSKAPKVAVTPITEFQSSEIDEVETPAPKKTKKFSKPKSKACTAVVIEEPEEVGPVAE